MPEQVDDCECGLRRSRALAVRMGQISPEFDKIIEGLNNWRIEALRVSPEKYHPAFNDQLDESLLTLFSGAIPEKVAVPDRVPVLRQPLY